MATPLAAPHVLTLASFMASVHEEGELEMARRLRAAPIHVSITHAGRDYVVPVVIDHGPSSASPSGRDFEMVDLSPGRPFCFIPERSAAYAYRPPCTTRHGPRRIPSDQTAGQ